MKPYPGSGQPGYGDFQIEIAPGSQETAANKEGEPVEFIASSEHPMERYGFTPNGDFGRWREVLDHSAAAVQLDRMNSGRAPFLVEHDRTDQIGVIASTALSNRQLRIKTRFSRSARAQDFLQDIKDRIRSSVSVGWIPKKAKLIEENAELGDLWRITLWQPFETSTVSIPANPEARVASKAGGHAFLPVIVEQEEEGKMPKEEQVDTRASAAARAVEGEEHVIEVDDHKEAVRAAQKEAALIYQKAREFGVAHLAGAWIGEGLNVAQVSEKILELVKVGKAGRKETPPTSVATDDRVGSPAPDQSGSKARVEGYSYARAISMAAAFAQRDGQAKFDGVEAEQHEFLRKNKPHNQPDHGGIFVPLMLPGRAALDTKTLTKGNELVFEQPGDLIEMLRNRSAVISLGARSLTGLSGPVAFPKQTSALTMYWVGENPGANVTASDLGLGLVTLQAKILQGTTSYSRALLAQASVDVENLVKTDFAETHALAIDRAAIHGLGANGEPMGIYVAPDCSSKAMGGQPTYANLVDMIGLVADKNADRGSLGWVTTPLMAARLKTVAEHATANMAGWIWQGTIEEGTLAGYRARATNQVSKTMTGTAGATTGGSDHGIIFGNWQDLIIGLFGSMELVVDPYALKKTGMIEVTSYQMVDIILRHGESFCRATGATTP